MSIIRTVIITVMAAALGLLMACSTPASRIKKNPELFQSLPGDVQTNVASGRIDLGYSHDAVRLALGEPNRQYTRRATGGKSTEVWSYTSEYSTTDRQRVDARVRGRDSDGSTRTYTDSVYVNVEQRHEYERLRVEFENGAVAAIETLER